MKSFLAITTSATNTLLVHFGSISETLHQWGDAFYRNGPMGLFILAVIESSFFPVPPDFVMIPLAYDSPEKSFYYATICTIGSVIGAVFGWLIGRYGGEPIVRRLDSILYIGMIIIGGLGTTAGPIFGVIFIRLLQQGITFIAPVLENTFALPAGFTTGIGPMAFGLAIILFLILEPRGLAHRWQLFKASYRLWPFSY